MPPGVPHVPERQGPEEFATHSAPVHSTPTPPRTTPDLRHRFGAGQRTEGSLRRAGAMDVVQAMRASADKGDPAYQEPATHGP